ncbi:MAG: acyltransferase [Solobacterium sp.]|nr:acyltransferase [Solobacterium sp.]
MKRTRSTRITGLDGLRTLALLGVLFYHAFPTKIKGGYFGVVLFFVISGFLTAYSSARKNTPVLPYYGKRLLRIYPALILMLFISTEAVALADMFKLMNAHEEIASVLLGYNNYWQIAKKADYFADLANTSAFTHLWYIAILVQFEVIWPWLNKLCQRRNGLLILSVITVVSMFIMPIRALFTDASATVLYYATDTRIHALLLGALAGMFVSRIGPLRLQRLPSLIITVLFLITTILLYLFVPGTNMNVYRFGLVLYALFCTLMVLVCAYRRNRIGCWLDLPICRFLSKYSYEIYLWQYPVMFVCGILKFNTNILHWLLQIVIIMILSMWTNTFVGALQKRLAGKS